MLVLSRKVNESIKIGENITLVVVEIRGDKVRLGIEAPKEVPVDRHEVHQAKKRSEGKEAGDKGLETGDKTDGVAQLDMEQIRKGIASAKENLDAYEAGKKAIQQDAANS